MGLWPAEMDPGCGGSVIRSVTLGKSSIFRRHHCAKIFISEEMGLDYAYPRLQLWTTHIMHLSYILSVTTVSKAGSTSMNFKFDKMPP